jgi:hypothetical protein
MKTLRSFEAKDLGLNIADPLGRTFVYLNVALQRRPDVLPNLYKAGLS